MSAIDGKKRKEPIASSLQTFMCGQGIPFSVLSLEFSCPPLIVLPLSSHEVDGVRKEKERLTAGHIVWRSS